jgi:hypothetical protein
MDENTDLPIGTAVIKTGGDYEWRGLVSVVLSLPNGKRRVVVAHKVDKGFVLHIYSPHQLTIISNEELVR